MVTLAEINKLWYDPGTRVLVRVKGGKSKEFTCVDCLWDKVMLSNGFYNFSVSKTDIYYRLEVEVPSGI